MTRTRYRWFIIFLLFAITVVNYIDRAAISYAIPAMQRDLGLSPADTGIILGAFGLGYALTTLTRRLRRRPLRRARGAGRRRHPVEPVDRSHGARRQLRRPLRSARAAGRVGRAQLPGPHRRGQPLAVAARAGDRIGQRLAGRAAGACDRRPDLHGSSRLARLAPHVRGPVRPVHRLGAAVVFPVPRRSGGVPFRQCRRARPYPGQRSVGVRRAACRPEILARARRAEGCCSPTGRCSPTPGPSSSSATSCSSS